MSRRSRWVVGAVIAIVAAGWIVPDAMTRDASGSPDDDPIAMVEFYLGHPVRHLLTVGYDVDEIPPSDEVCVGLGRHRVTARSWWFLPVTAYEVGCGEMRVVSGL